MEKYKINIMNLFFLAFLSLVTIFLCITFDSNDAKVFNMYMIFMFMSVVLAKISSLHNNLLISKLFLILSIICMSFLLCFRKQSGIDDIVYKGLFEKASNMNFFDYLNSSDIEFGYKIINYLINRLTGNYNVCQFFFSFVPIAIIEIKLWQKREYIDFSFALLYVYMTLYYFIISAGLVRIFFAVSIVFYGLDFIVNNNKKKYILCVIIASLFHRSALFMLLLLILLINDEYFYKRVKLFSCLVFVLVPLILFFVSKYIAPLLGERYSSYSQMESVGNASLLSFADKLPFLILGIFYYNTMKKEQYENFKEYQLSLILIILTISINIASIWTDLGRLVYYTNTGIILMMSLIINNKKIKSNFDGMILTMVMTIIPYFYLMHTIFKNQYLWDYLKLYEFIF